MQTAIVSLGGLGLVFGLVLAVASYVFRVESDERIEKISDVLPGANCGGCGYPGCSGYAEAIVTSGADISLCAPGGAELVQNIAQIMGVEASESVRKTAFVRCKGTESLSLRSSTYIGIRDCTAAALVAGGDKACESGCLGYASCVDACPFDAIRITDEGIAEVDPGKCTGCGKCIAVCPRNLITLVPAEKKVHVMCMSPLPGPAVKKVCQTGCIGCKICEKVCPVEAIKVTDNLAVIDYDKCIGCMLCVEKCPVHIIKGEPRTTKRAVITNDCVGCTLCVKACPVGAVSGERKQKHFVDVNKCIGCGICVDKCPKKAIELKDV